MQRSIEDQLFAPDVGRELGKRGSETALDRAGPEFFTHFRRVVELKGGSLLYITIDDVRLELGKRGVPDPLHPGAWGGAIRACVSLGIIKSTDQYRRTVLKSSHGRPVAVWRWVPMKDRVTK